MRKIPTLYERDPGTNYRTLTRTVHPDCQWVIDGEGWPTYKWNGTAVRIDDDGKAWKRRELRADFIDRSGERVTVEPPARNTRYRTLEGAGQWWQEGEADPATGKRVGWTPVDPDDPGDKWHREALDAALACGVLTAGTYELVGPKVQGNPHGLAYHQLIPHGMVHLQDVPTGYDELAEYMSDVAAKRRPLPEGFEGIVWHHPDGRMCKIKAKDFPDDALV